MRLSIRAKLSILFIAILFLDFSIFFGYFLFAAAPATVQALEHWHTKQVAIDSRILAHVKDLYPNRTEIQTYIDDISREYPVHVTVSTWNGDVLSSPVNVAPKTISIHWADVITTHNKPVGYVQIENFLTQAAVARASNIVKYALALALVIIICSTVALGIYLNIKVIKPVLKLHARVAKVSFGVREPELEYKTKDELGDLIQNFNRMDQRLQQSHRDQLEIISSISHDIKTPLTSIVGYIERLLDGKAQSAEKQAEYLTVIHRKAQDIARLMEEFSAYSATESELSEMDLVPTSAKAFFESLCREYAEEFSLTDVSYDYSCNMQESTKISIDERMIRRVFGNIIENALRYAPSPQQIQIHIRERDTSIECTISDSGKGVPNEDLDKIFERFYRVEKSRGRSTAGSGLGLATCRSIVRFHRGDIRAYNTPSGFSISFTLPKTSSAM